MVKEVSDAKQYDMMVLILKSHVEKIIFNISEYKTFDECPKNLISKLMKQKIDGYYLIDIFQAFYKYSSVQLTFAEYLYLLFNRDFKSRPFCKNYPKCQNIPNFRNGTRGYSKECSSCYTDRIDKNKKEVDKKLEQETEYIDYEEELKDFITHKSIKEFMETEKSLRKELVRIDRKTNKTNKIEYDNKINSKVCHRFITCSNCNKTHTIRYNKYNSKKINNIHICPKCNPPIRINKRSNVEDAIIENFIAKLAVNVIRNDQTYIYPKELDCVADGIAFEFDGDRYHTEKKLNSINYHLEKTEAVEALKMKLVRINTNILGIDRNFNKNKASEVFEKLIRLFSWLFPNQNYYKNPVLDLKKYEKYIEYKVKTRSDITEFFDRNHINGTPLLHEMHHAGIYRCLAMYIPTYSDPFSSIIYNEVKTDKGKDAYIYRYANKDSCITERGSTLHLFANRMKHDYNNIYYVRDRNWDFLDHPNYSLKNFNFLTHISMLPPKFLFKDFLRDVYIDYKINSDGLIESIDELFDIGRVFTEDDMKLKPTYDKKSKTFKDLADYGKIWNAGFELLKIKK